MNLKQRLMEKKSSILTTWRDATLVIPPVEIEGLDIKRKFMILNEY